MADHARDSFPLPWFYERHYIVLIVIVLFLIFFAATLLLLHDNHQTKRKIQLTEDRISAKLLGLILEEHIRGLQRVLESYSHRPLLVQAARKQSVAEAEPHLSNLSKSNPHIGGLMIANASGTVWTASPSERQAIGRNLSYRDWYKGVSRNWDSYVTDAVLRVVAEKDMAFQIAVPLRDQDGRVAGILVSTQRISELRRIIEQLDFVGDASIQILDRKGNIIYCSADQQAHQLTPYPLFGKISNLAGGSSITLSIPDSKHEPRGAFVSVQHIENPGWYVLLERNRRAILLSELNNILRIIAISALLFLIILFALLYLRKKQMAEQALQQMEAEKRLRKSAERYKSSLPKIRMTGCICGHRTGNSFTIRRPACA